MAKRKIKIIALALTLALTTTTFAFAGDVPGDVTGKPYEKAVSALITEGIITGDTDGSFHPDENLTRAQACVIIVKSMNPPVADVSATVTQPAPKSGFLDMSGYSWAEGYISYAVKTGITKGYPDGNFQPGSKVTMNELTTMVLRAAGVTDESLGGVWPENYLNKAKELQLLDNLPESLPALAAKWMAAQLDYNALEKIRAANPAKSVSIKNTYIEKIDVFPSAGSMEFVSGRFNETMTAFSGKPIAADAKIYTYGFEKDYTGTMTFSSKTADYRGDTVYKYRDVKTPAFYKMENGKITVMVIPSDVGFTNKVYSVINDTEKVSNAKNESVTGLITLTAERPITWLTDKTLSGIPSKDQYLQGELYEFEVANGVVQGIHKASDEGKAGKLFKEISSKKGGFVTVASYDGRAAKIDEAGGSETVVLKKNMSVYILDSKTGGYREADATAIKAGVQIRAYDITDDLNLSADIIIVKTK